MADIDCEYCNKTDIYKHAWSGESKCIYSNIGSILAERKSLPEIREYSNIILLNINKLEELDIGVDDVTCCAKYIVQDLNDSLSDELIKEYKDLFAKERIDYE